MATDTKATFRLRVCAGRELKEPQLDVVGALWESAFSADGSHRRFEFTTPSPRTEKLVTPFNRTQFEDDTFFLLELPNGKLAAAARLRPTSITTRSGSHSILGVADVASDASVRGQGFGGKLVTALAQHARDTQQPALGFCASRNAGFYEKQGFHVVRGACQWFMYTAPDGQEQRDEHDDDVIVVDPNQTLVPAMEEMITARQTIALQRPHW